MSFSAPSRAIGNMMPPTEEEEVLGPEVLVGDLLDPLLEIERGLHHAGQPLQVLDPLAKLVGTESAAHRRQLEGEQVRGRRPGT